MIIAAVIIVILLGVGGYMVLGKSKTAPSSSNTQTQKENTNAITSIQDAIAKSMTLTCDYTTPEGTTVKAYIKGGKIRSDVVGKTANDSGSAIIMGKKVYFWNAQGGFMMDMPDITVTPAKGQDTVENKGSSTLDALEQYKQYCKVGSVSDSLFVLPTGVKFQDMSQMMNAYPSGTKVAPSGTMPSGMSQEQIQEMMKKYQSPSQ